jgi:hypothetical protein
MKRKEKKGFKHVLKNHLISLIVVMTLVCIGAVIAGNVIVKEGNVEVDEDLNVSDDLFVASRIGIGKPADGYYLLEATGSGAGGQFTRIVNGSAGAFFEFMKAQGSVDSPTAVTSDHQLGKLTAGGHNGSDYVGSSIIYFKSNGAIGPGVPGRILFYTANASGVLIRRMDITSSGSNYLYGKWTIDNDIVVGDDVVVADRLYFETTGEASIYWDGSQLRFDYGTDGDDFAYFSGNVSAIDYYTRTSVYDKSQGSALDKIKDADDLKTDGEIDHSKFYGYATYEVTDLSRPETEEYSCVKADENGEEYDAICERTVYPYTETEEGVSLNAEIDVLRQAVYELKTELCKHDSSYDFC